MVDTDNAHTFEYMYVNIAGYLLFSSSELTICTAKLMYLQNIYSYIHMHFHHNLDVFVIFYILIMYPLLSINFRLLKSWGQLVGAGQPPAECILRQVRYVIQYCMLLSIFSICCCEIKSDEAGKMNWTIELQIWSWELPQKFQETLIEIKLSSNFVWYFDRRPSLRVVVSTTRKATTACRAVSTLQR